MLNIVDIVYFRGVIVKKRFNLRENRSRISTVRFGIRSNTISNGFFFRKPKFRPNNNSIYVPHLKVYRFQISVNKTETKLITFELV